MEGFRAMAVQLEDFFQKMNQAGIGVKLCRHLDDLRGRGSGGARGNGKGQLGEQRMLQCVLRRELSGGPDGPEMILGAAALGQEITF